MSQAHQILQKLLDEQKLSPEGLAWLTVATDPWHDTKIKGVAGLPDTQVGDSLVFQVVQELVIVKPAALGAGNWKVRIANQPFLQHQDVGPGTYYGDVVSIDNSLAFGRELWPVQVNYALDASDFASTVPLGSTGIELPQEFTKGTIKLIGMGIEVFNTTAEISKQGTVSYIRMSQPDTDDFAGYVSMTTPVNAWSFRNLRPFREPPKNLAEMSNYPGFAQTEAREGYYAPVIIKVNANNRNYPITKGLLTLSEDPEGGAIPVTGIPCHSSQNAPFLVPGNTTPFYSSRNNPIFVDTDSNVVMFTGLSDATTLTLRVRFICERFPNDSEKQMLVIATPTAPYDPVAIELYTRAISQMPSGVPFSENPAGEWWLKMINEVASLAAPLLSSIHPLAGAGARLIGNGADSLRKDWRRERKKGEAKKPPANELIQAQRQFKAPRKSKPLPPLPTGPPPALPRRPKAKR
jgi:hypothetical protein